MQLKIAAAIGILTLLGVPVAHFATYRAALASGRNSLAMTVLGRRGTILLLKIMFRIMGKNPDKARTGMVQEAESRFHKARMEGEALLIKDEPLVMFVGSSTFTYWTHLHRDMRPFSCLNLAFGGSITLDLLPHVDYFAGYNPMVIVYYCGANDISMGRTPQQAAEGFARVVADIRSRIPTVRFVYVSIAATPWQKSIGRIDAVKEANRIVEEYVSVENRLAKKNTMAFVDMNRDERFVSNWEWYLNDGLHLNDIGHVELGNVIKPAVKSLLDDLESKY